MTRVLLVDDEPQLVRALSINLRARNYDVNTSATGKSALKVASQQPPDLVVLDLGLPDMDGVDVIRGLRAWLAAPIIVLSARVGSHDKVEALDAGADDYLTKPFGMDELLARVRAAVRRAAPADDSPPVIDTPSFTIDLVAKRVTTPEGIVRLTPTEWHILELLARHPGKLVSQTQLLHEVWGPAYAKETHYLRVYMGQLRRKLEPNPARPRYFVTETGIGYRFEP